MDHMGQGGEDKNNMIIQNKPEKTHSRKDTDFKINVNTVCLEHS